jgi:predicted nucleotidyltransferase
VVNEGGLNLIFREKNAIKVLKFLIEHSDKDFYLTELKKQIGLSMVTLLKIIKIFDKESLITVNQRGGVNYISLDLEDPIVKQFKTLFNVANVKANTENLKEIAEVYLYGSSARGEDRPASDFDILILSELNPNVIFKKLKKEKTPKSRQFSVIVMKPFEYAQLATKDYAFFNRVEIDKIKVV